jgi:hypothetical protein
MAISAKHALAILIFLTDLGLTALVFCIEGCFYCTAISY